MTTRISRTAVRQGETAGRMRRVLFTSTGLAVISLIAVAEFV